MKNTAKYKLARNILDRHGHFVCDTSCPAIEGDMALIREYGRNTTPVIEELEDLLKFINHHYGSEDEWPLPVAGLVGYINSRLVAKRARS